MIYSQLRKKIEQEKRQFQNGLKEIQEINSSPKVYQHYETKNPNSSLKNSPQTKNIQKEMITTSKFEYKVDQQLITKLKQITEIKREDKVAKITSQLEHYHKKSVLLSTELAQLKHLIEQKDEEMAVIETSYKQKLLKSAEKQSKIQQEEINLKTIIKDLRQILLQRDQQIAKLEGNVYEFQKYRKEKEEQLLKYQDICRLVKQQNEKLELTLNQQNQVISTFIDNTVNKLNLFQEPILQVIQLKTEVISKTEQSLFFEQLQTKIKSIKQSNQNKTNEINSLKNINQQLQIQIRQLIKQKDEFKIILELKQNQIGRETDQIEKLEAKIKEMMSKAQLSQNKIQQLMHLNLELSQKMEIVHKKQKETEVQYQQKIQILVNQVKTKVDEIKEIKNFLVNQTQLYEKDRRQAQNKLRQKDEKIQEYDKTNSQIKQLYSEFIPQEAQMNQTFTQYTLQKICTELLTTKKQQQRKNKRIQQLQQLKNELQIQRQIFKTNYLTIQTKMLLLQTKNQELQIKLKQQLQLLNQQKVQNESLSLKNQEKSILQNRLIQSHYIYENFLNNMSEIINKIKLNCLKNNCDSNGIISIELSKILGVDQKILEPISSPTDFERFNKTGQINAIQEFKLQYDQKQAKNKLNQIQQQPSEQIQARMQRKKSQDVSKVRFDENKQSKIKKDAKVKSVSLIEEQQPKEIKELSKQAFSIENNPDVPQIVIPYAQLLQKYKDLKCDLQKMQEYICHVHNINFKIKKGIHEADEHNKHSIDKLSQKIAMLVKHNEVFLKNETQQFTNEISKILNEIQNYIHFVDQISKIQPFTHEYNKSISKFNRMKRKVTQHIKNQKQGVQKHAYSEGDSREDDFVDHFDAHPYEQDQDFPLIDSQTKEIGKKQHEGMQKYFEERRQLYSEISSVKNKSLKSHNSFMNSRSQLWQLVKNKFTEDCQQHEHDVFKKQSNDSERLSQMSIKDIKTKYYKLKKENQSLNKLKSHFQKHCKKLESQEQDYKKKIAKMTKQFNDSFKFLCQVSGKHIVPQRQKLNVNVILQKESRLEVATSPKVLKIYKLSEKDEIIKRPEQMKSETKILAKQEIKQLELQNQLLKIKIKEMDRKNDEISKLNQIKVKGLQLKLKKYEEQFASFIKKSISKVVIQPQSPVISPRIVLQCNRVFRKNSNSFKEVDIISPPRQDPMNLTDLYQTLNKVLNIQKGSQLNDKINLKQFQQTISKSIQKSKKAIYLQILVLIRQQLQKFMHIYNEQQRVIQLEKIHSMLGQHFVQNENINHLFLLTKEIMFFLNRQSEVQVESLSINSNCDEKMQPVYEEKAVQNHEENKLTEQEQSHYLLMKQQIQFLLCKNTELSEQLSEWPNKVEQKNRLIQIQAEEISRDKLKIEQKWLELQNQNKQLRQQLQKSKLRGVKKNKIYHIGY